MHNAALSKRDSSVHTAASNSAPEPAKTKKPSLRGTSASLAAAFPDVCYRCHQGSHRMNELTGPHQISANSQFKCNDLPRRTGNSFAPVGKGTLPELPHRIDDFELALVDP